MSKTQIDNSIKLIKSAVDYNVEDFWASLAIKEEIDKQRDILVEYFRSMQDTIFDLEHQIQGLQGVQPFTNSGRQSRDLSRAEVIYPKSKRKLARSGSCSGKGCGGCYDKNIR